MPNISLKSLYLYNVIKYFLINYINAEIALRILEDNNS